MNNKLPFALFAGFTLWVGFLVAFTSKISAVSIAEQTQGYDSSLNVWQAIQELGSNLSGTASSFTFRVSTSASNINQFDYTAENSRIYDKTTNTNITGCVPTGSNPTDRLRGLTFTTQDITTRFEDVTIDFSCRNYNFIPGHRYLILLTNANMAQYGGMKMKLASVTYSGTSNDFFTGGGLRYSFDNGSCNAGSYVWNSQSANAGCNIFSSPKSDLYFILNNTSPPPRLPVIFIPGIGGSEFKAAENIFWVSKNDGHGGIYSHAYENNETIWVNQAEAKKLGDDDYFDVLRLKTDGVTPEAPLSLTGNLTSFGYSDIDSFFTDMGYVKGTNFFIFPYDWRKDIRNTKDSLDTLIESAKIASGQPKVNIVVHSMGGLVARYYISDSSKASKVNKLIELGVPHLGAVDAIKALIYGKPLGRQILGDFYLGIPASEVRDLFQNSPSAFQLLPSSSYFNFYDNSSADRLSPFRDDRDIDNNGVVGDLNFDKIKNLLSNLNYNTIVFNFGEQLHNFLDPLLNQTNGTKVYEIVGSSQPTLGQIHETWWIAWPVNLIPKTDEIFINGDGTVPLYSASLKSDFLDISGATAIYYVEQKHSDLVTSGGTAMQTVKAILNDDNSLPVEVKNQKITLEGEQISLDDGELDLYDNQNRHCGLNDKGEIEENIPDVTCTTSGNTKNAFVKKKVATVKVTATRKNPTNTSKTVTLKTKTYAQDKIIKTTIYKDIVISTTSKIEFILNPNSLNTPILSNGIQTILATSEATGSAALDQTPPATSIQISGPRDASGIYAGPVIITLTGTDTESGILKIEYSLDNGQTVQTYTGPFIISAPGKNTLQIKSIDKLGNEEIPQTIMIEIAIPPTPSPSSSPTPTPSPTPNPSSDPSPIPSPSPISTPTPAPTNTPYSYFRSPDMIIQKEENPTPSPAVLGVNFQNPPADSDQTNINKPTVNSTDSETQIYGVLILILGGIIGLLCLGLLARSSKPSPKEMNYKKPE